MGVTKKIGIKPPKQKKKVFVPLPNAYPVKAMEEEAPEGEVCMVYLPIKCVVRRNGDGREANAPVKFFEVLDDNPKAWAYNSQGRLILGYLFDEFKGEIDVMAKVEKLKAEDKALTEMLVTRNAAKFGLLTKKSDNDGKDEIGVCETQEAHEANGNEA